MTRPARRVAPPSSPHATATMRANRRVDTGPERALRSALHRRGLRFRIDAPIADGGPGRPPRPDIVFTRARVAVFVDGCFWHACPEHGSLPVANRDFWKDKLEKNVARDRATDHRLAEAGWAVVRVWEHESVETATQRVISTLRPR